MRLTITALVLALSAFVGTLGALGVRADLEQRAAAQAKADWQNALGFINVGRALIGQAPLTYETRHLATPEEQRIIASRIKP